MGSGKPGSEDYLEDLVRFRGWKWRPTRAPHGLAGRSVSGRYHYNNSVGSFPGAPAVLQIWVRVDVDGFFPQDRISITVREDTSAKTYTAEALVSVDKRTGVHRWITANRINQDTSSSLPGTAGGNLGSSHLLDEVFPRFERFLFEATRDQQGHERYVLTLEGPEIEPRSYPLTFESRHFDSVDIDLARVQGAAPEVTSYDTSTHPTRPKDLPLETLSLATVFDRAGFGVSMSSDAKEIQLSDAGADGAWSKAELHNAMVTYWSRWADRPQWAVWVLFAAQPEDSVSDPHRARWGLMFDQIGASQRLGAAVFTTRIEELQKRWAPSDSNPAWHQRMKFYAAAHEIGHAFNLPHCFRESQWIPHSESRTFMNYPQDVVGGVEAFFSTFRFRFDDDELVFMRHAPRHFVQMGNANFLHSNAGLDGDSDATQTGRWALTLRANRESNAFSFLEPVVMEFKLTNASASEAPVDAQVLDERITVWVQRSGGVTRRWRPMVTAQCCVQHATPLNRGASLYGAHLVSASAQGWLIDEPGTYSVRAAVDVGGEIVFSNVVTLHVARPGSDEESKLAPDYFTEDAARCLVFGGAPGLPAAMNTLEEIAARCTANPAALHATRALALPKLRNYKVLEIGDDRSQFAIRSAKADVSAAAKTLTAALLNEPDRAADTFGHIKYFAALNGLVSAMTSAGNDVDAKQVNQHTIATMKRRNILASVVESAERKFRV